MSKVVAVMSMSLDGYVADRNDDVSEVFAWLGTSIRPDPRDSRRMASTQLDGPLRDRWR